jgi:hypothetical protein
MHQISIDFVAGSHGNFLEFVCNKFIGKLDLDFTPFKSSGSSHIKPKYYQESRIFLADHYVLQRNRLCKKIIRITFEEDDLLLLSSVSFLRAGDINIDNELLEHNTYNKLSNRYYKSLVVEINNAYPTHELSEQTPNCPRYILREFFKFGFKNPTSHGLIGELKKLKYSSEHQIFDFAFKDFYDATQFSNRINELAEWCNTTIDNIDYLTELHQTFLDRQLYKNDKIQADFIINCVQNKQQILIPKLKLLQESYINGVLENIYNIEMPFEQLIYFSNTLDIINYIKSHEEVTL